MDPLSQAMNMADSVRRQIDSMVRQGTRGIKASLPELPAFPGMPEGFPALPGNGEFPGLPEGLPEGLPTPDDILSRLPTLPGFNEVPTIPEIPVVETVGPESVTRSMERQVPLRPLNHAGVGRRF